MGILLITAARMQKPPVFNGMMASVWGPFLQANK